MLEKNLFDVKPEDIGKTKVIYTMMNGVVTYDSAAQPGQ